MSPESVITTCKKYSDILTRTGAKPVRNVHALDSRERLDHLRWMCDEVPSFVDAGIALADRGKIEKAMRWLGFIQGALMTMNVLTIEQMKEDNR